MTHLLRQPAWLAFLGLAGVLLGCRPPVTTGPANPAPGPGPMPQASAAPQIDRGPFTGGKKVFAEVSCSRCHTVDGVRLVSSEGPPPGGQPGVYAGPGGPPPGPGGPPPGPGGAPGGPPGPGGPGGRMGPRAPDLGHVAKAPEHTADWFIKYVRDPKAVNPKARMPAFGEQKINDENLRALAQYLTTLK